MQLVHDHGVYWLVSAVLAVAAIIDGRELRVPNWLTFPFALAGLAASSLPGGLGPSSSLGGLALGLALLLPLYAVGGMGAGDVKLLAGVGAWVGPAIVFHAFVATVVVGAVMAAAMMVASGRLGLHVGRMARIAGEWFTIRNPAALAAIAAERKPTMTLLPYGIPMAIGTVGYFAAAGLLF
jgi:prepilin peptidase CpaA